MNVTIFIVSHKKDFAYLKWCLKSIAKFATGFYEIRLVVPHGDLPALAPLLAEYNGPIPLSVTTAVQWGDKGMLFHEWCIIESDLHCPKADFICHIDSDCIFTEPATPDVYFKDGKPILMHASFQWLGTHHPGVLNWKVAAEKALGWLVTDEIMRRISAVHYRKLYELCRARIESHTRMSTEDYIRSCENSFPQTFADYPTLGATAWYTMRQEYHWVNQQTEPWPADPIMQMWGHGNPKKPQQIWWKGKEVEVVPEFEWHARLT